MFDFQAFGSTGAIVGVFTAILIYFAKKYLQSIETSVSHIPELSLKVSEISVKMDLKHTDYEAKLKEHEIKIAHLESIGGRQKRPIP